MPTQNESKRWQTVAEAFEEHPEKMQTKIDATRAAGYEFTFALILKYAQSLLRGGDRKSNLHDVSLILGENGMPTRNES